MERTETSSENLPEKQAHVLVQTGSKRILRRVREIAEFTNW